MIAGENDDQYFGVCEVVQPVRLAIDALQV
jgi:hypothetical protein